MRSISVMCAVLLAAAGCKSGDDDSGGTGGTNGGSGGVHSGSGGTGGMAGGGTGGMAGGGAGSSATGEPKWSAIYQEIVVATGCNGGPLCHAGMVGKLTMVNMADAYTALVGMDAMGTNIPPGGKDCKDSGLKRVVAGDPDHSLLMLKVEAMQPCGTKMPPGDTSMLTAAQIAQIRMWIQNGAKND